MPYIKEEDRERFYQWLSEDDEREPRDLGQLCTAPGELNYLITQLLIGYLEEHGECYQTYNDMIGVLECAKLELYRRKIKPYEQLKCNENGDVYY